MKRKKTEIISDELISRVSREANENPRGRTNFNFHDLDEVYQRFLNVLTRDTYIQPHMHTGKPETFIVLKGKVGCIIFDELGVVAEKHVLSTEGPVYGVDILPKQYHTIICLSREAVCFEGKSGPYIADKDKNFSSWSPSEKEEESLEYLDQLRRNFLTD